jgi:hypothetical protein
LHWLSRKQCSDASFKACAMSAISSDGCSMPIDSRIVESRTPIFWRMSAGTPEWVMLAGRRAGKRLSAAQAHRRLEDPQRVQEIDAAMKYRSRYPVLTYFRQLCASLNPSTSRAFRFDSGAS